MKNQEALFYFNQGIKMVHADQLNEALDFFTKAIELNPNYNLAYQNRGEVFHMLGKAVESNADIQKARALRSDKISDYGKSATSKVQKINLKDAENIYDDVFSSHVSESGEVIQFDSEAYEYIFSDDTLGSDALCDCMADDHAGRNGFPAVLEYLNGDREEVPEIILCKPSQNEITLVQDVDRNEKIISFEQLSCIKVAGLPPEFAQKKDSNCHVEIIETIDGNIYHKCIHPEQRMKNVLLGFSTKEEARFIYTLIPLCNIRKRYQRRFLGQIMLEKGFIAGDVFKHALEEHKQLKQMKFGRIIAQQARILYSSVEVEIQKAYEANKKGFKVGEILLDAGLVTEEQILKALDYQKKLQSRKIGRFLIEKGIVQEKEVYMALAEKFRIPFIELRTQKVSRKILDLLPRDLIVKLNVLPISVNKGSLVVATLLPDPSSICELILRHAPLEEVKFMLAQPSHLRNVIRALYQKKV